MTSVARPLAGPGFPGTALNIVERAGWTITSDDKANAYAFPADRRVIVAFLPEGLTVGVSRAMVVVKRIRLRNKKGGWCR